MKAVIPLFDSQCSNPKMRTAKIATIKENKPDNPTTGDSNVIVSNIKPKQTESENKTVA